MKVSEKRREHIKPCHPFLGKLILTLQRHGYLRIGTYDSFYKQLIETKVAQNVKVGQNKALV